MFQRSDHLEVVLDRVADDRLQHGERSKLQMEPSTLEILAQTGQSAVVAVAHRDDEVGADEDHDLACLGNTASRLHGFVRYIVDGFDHDEQGVVIPIHLRPLLGVDGVLDGDGMESERGGDGRHLVLGRFAQAEPDERPLTLFVQLTDGLKGGVIALCAGQTNPVEVHRAIHDGLLDGSRFGGSGLDAYAGTSRTPGGAERFGAIAVDCRAAANRFGPCSPPVQLLFNTFRPSGVGNCPSGDLGVGPRKPPPCGNNGNTTSSIFSASPAVRLIVAPQMLPSGDTASAHAWPWVS